MEIVDRYLYAVRFWLPKDRGDDIIAELSEDILSQIADEETGLGRKLSGDEVCGILKQRGHPMLVAGRFLPQQALIGPPWFPIYIFALRIVFLWVYLPIFVLSEIAVYFFSPDDLGTALGGFWTGALSLFGVVTIVFAVLHRFQHRLDEMKWDPHRLRAVPRARNWRRIPRAGSVAEIIWGALFVLCWTGIVQFPFRAGNAIHLSLTPVWRQFYWPVLVVALVSISLACANLARPWWSRPRAGLKVAINGAITVMAWVLARTGNLVEVSAANLDVRQLAIIRQTIGVGVSIAFAIIGISGIVNSWLILRSLRPAGWSLHSAFRDSAAGRSGKVLF